MTQQPPYNPNDPGYNNPGYAAPQSGPSTNSVEAKGFFAGLFDFSFQTFVTLKFARFIYIIIMIVIGLWAIFGWLIGSIVLMTQEPLVGLLGLLLGWIPMLLGLIFARLMLEFYVAMARTAQNTAGTRVELERLRTMNGQ